MRALTSIEMEQCAGGIETVTVTASRINFSWGGGGYSYSGDGGGTRSFTPREVNQDEPPPPTDEELVDAFAYYIQHDILAQTDHNEREYGTVIYQDRITGEIKALPLTRGETVAEAERRGGPGTPPETRISTAGTDGGVILAIIHNHPDIGYDNAGDQRNKLPSDNDWNAGQTLINGLRAETSTFAEYIVGPDGQLREYDYASGRPTSATTPIS